MIWRDRMTRDDLDRDWEKKMNLGTYWIQHVGMLHN